MQPWVGPLYDLLAAAIYPQLTPKMAMKLCSKYQFSELEARHWEQFADEAGLAKAATRKRLQQLANELPAAARKLQTAPEHGFAGNAVVEQIAQLIEQRCALTLWRLA
ncbi:HipA domain-containing protein [Comamonas testosteroni]|uniref:HipA domain-containing protein n=1 Tax=Comamonas testosteroni TaxID=285 RepID=UPI0005B4B161|nr:HipA domain-containing protein [Comamonas testosteroni]